MSHLYPNLARLIADVDPIVLLLFFREALARLTDSSLQFGKTETEITIYSHILLSRNLYYNMKAIDIIEYYINRVPYMSVVPLLFLGSTLIETVPAVYCSRM